MEEAVTDPEIDMGSTCGKCPEMSQSMLREGGPSQNFGTENGSFPEIDDFLNFQETENEDFSSLLDTKRTRRRALGPRYRVINKYVKSSKQYWKERNRRKKAWQLSGKGFTYEQIAEKLGVSEKTVQRDIKRIQPYYARLRKAYWRKLQVERQTKLRELLKGKTVFQQLDILWETWKTYKQLLKVREYNRHVIKIIIDMDDITDGCPALHLWPRPPLTLQGSPYYFKFIVQHDGQQENLGSLIVK